MSNDLSIYTMHELLELSYYVDVRLTYYQPIRIYEQENRSCRLRI